MTHEYFKCGQSNSRCAVSVKCRPGFKYLVPKKVKHLSNFLHGLHFNFGHIHLKKISKCHFFLFFMWLLEKTLITYVAHISIG